MTGFRLPDWEKMFVPDGSLLESFLRGVVVYFAVLALFRLVLKRQLGSVGFGDILLLVFVSEAASQALTAQLNSVPNGMAVVAALMVCTYLTDWASYKYRWVRRLLVPKPLPLVVDGEPVPENLRQEFISTDELRSHLRRAGVADLAKVRSACLEGDGEISVIQADEAGGAGCAAGPECEGPKPQPQGGEREQGADAPRSPGPPDFDAAMRDFLDAARRLQGAAAWHDDRAAEHRKRAADARDALKRFGVQPKALLAPDPPADSGPPAEVNGTHPAGHE